jgi:hypothetical protein
MFGRPLARISDIQQQGRIRARQLVLHHGGADPFGRPHQVRSAGERFHASLQVSFDVSETDTAQAQGGFLLAARLGDDHNGPGTVPAHVAYCALAVGVHELSPRLSDPLAFGAFWELQRSRVQLEIEFQVEESHKLVTAVR